MRKYYKMLGLVFACSILFSGCGDGSNSVLDYELIEGGEAVDRSPAPDDPSAPVDAPRATTPPGIAQVEAVPTVYGNSIGNVYNAGLFLVNNTEKCFYLYNSYADSIYNTDQVSGLSAVLGNSAFTHLNRVGNKLYGILEAGERQDGSIVEVNLANGKQKVYRKGDYAYLLAVDDELFYLDMKDMSLCKLNVNTKRETVLVDEEVNGFDIWENMIYFRRVYDDGCLYSISINGGEMTKINDVSTITPMVYEGRVYYMARENKRYSLRSINVDGTDERIYVETQAEYSNIHDGIWYYIDPKQRDVISYLDLSQEAPEVQTLDLTEQVRVALKEAALKSFADYEVKELSYLNFSGNYMLFLCTELLDNSVYTSEYIYNMTRDEVIVVSAFCTLPE